MTAACAVLALLMGLAYTGLGLLTASELVRSRASRGYSHFGGAFTVMALTCGPHHLSQFTHLATGTPGNGHVLGALLLGLPPGLVFILLRIEAAAGGRGDRFIAGTPGWLFALPVVWGAGYGALVVLLAGAPDLRGGLPLALNVVLAACYAIAGWCVLRTQASRRPHARGWSLSGLCFGTLLPTCGVVHVVHVTTTPDDVHGLLIDLVGVPAALYFLWVVWSLHRDALVDWNRRPVVGRAEAPRRRSPWAARLPA